MPYRSGSLRLIALLGLLLCGAVHAHDDRAAHARPQRVLGAIDFPTSARSPEAQQAFVRGMLLLHLFEYPFAKDEFVEAQRLEPGFALAYWGEAMTYNHPIWAEQDAAKARAALAKLAPTPAQRAAKAPTPRERAFLAAVEQLYGDGPKQERDRAYTRATQAMAERFPGDSEVQLQYALALMGEHAGVRDVRDYMQAAAIAQRAFCANPRHPGAAHYLIHAVDDPDHAVLGLDAARALEKMAPDASHSLHMASHIYVALGMWDDVVRANEAATAVRDRMNAERGEKPQSWGHQNFWLLYGYLQQGRHAQARRLLEAARAQAVAGGGKPLQALELDPDNSTIGSAVQMWLRYLIETGEWNGDVADWSFPVGDAFDPRLNVLYARSLRAALGGNADAAIQARDAFRTVRDELRARLDAQPEHKPTDAEYLRRLGVLDEEMTAQAERARGNLVAAIEHAGEASRLEGEMPYSFGPPFIDWPAAEMHGALLHDDHDDVGAVAAYDTQLARARQRVSALLGKARSERVLGHAGEADHALAQARSILHAADAPVRARLDPGSGSGR